ncbi:hypothetical protein Cgig2_012484 [Carnegiea gigantea]|uniref:Kinesin motor domain-containing protein n=1 Tax=Carnegiea gigantea TaxID=171969 RepID=A0A9Q1K6B0_9CARY|nr:hypothetical protein Cgig2_012484 [Carnegiea gigantea]
MGPNTGAKARIVARIRGQSKKEAEFFDGVSMSKQPWISVQKPDEKSNSNLVGRVKISLELEKTTSGKQSYDVDECYEQDVGTEEIFSREIKPLIPGLFGGQNITVFAYGPRNSGKTYTIQGTHKEFGLAALTIDSILPRVEEEGKVITVSVFEVHQDRVIDLLDSKKPEVSVFEDGQGKIRLKGLSKVKVNSLCEFQKIRPAANAHKASQKTIFERPHRSHIGCIVHIVSPQTENSNAQLVGKINFIDLASYEDSRRKSSDGFSLSETTRINKSLFAVHNVLYALNANEARVPYRESKLTRMLQDSLGGVNRALMVTCMNPSFCPETVQTISIASRSCQAGFLACLDPGKSSRSATEIGMSSPQVSKPASKVGTKTSMFSPRVIKPMSASASAKKQGGGSLLRMTLKKSSILASEVRGRKLFDEVNQSKNGQLGNTLPEVASAVESSTQNEDETCPETAAIVGSLTETELMLPQENEPAFESSSLEEETPAPNASDDTDSSHLPLPEDVVQVENNDVAATPSAYQTPKTCNFLLEDKENKCLSLNNTASPPLSARIRELSNNLKSLCVSTESSLKIAQDSSIRSQLINEIFEPKTPVRVDDTHEIANIASPWENFQMRGSGMKDSLVREYLKFLNSASKEELKGLKGIGEKRATYILEMRQESPEPFKKLEDLKDIGLSEKQINGMLKKVAGDLFA